MVVAAHASLTIVNQLSQADDKLGLDGWPVVGPTAVASGGSPGAASFSNCHANEDGGAIVLGAGSTALLRNVTMSDLTAGRGGALCLIQGAYADIAHSAISHSTVTGSGGLFFLTSVAATGTGTPTPSYLLVSHSTLSYGIADNDGGLLAFESPSPPPSSATASGSYASFQDTYAHHLQAGANGGCVSLTLGTTLRMLRTNMTHCYSGVAGGGISSNNAALVNLTQSHVTNTRAITGGFLYATHSTSSTGNVHLDRTIITGSTAWDGLGDGPWLSPQLQPQASTITCHPVSRRSPPAAVESSSCSGRRIFERRRRQRPSWHISRLELCGHERRTKGGSAITHWYGCYRYGRASDSLR